MKIITMNYNPVTGQSYATIIEAPIGRLPKNKKQKSKKTYGQNVVSSKYNVHSRVLPTYKQVVVVTTTDVELNNTKIKTIQNERIFINPLVAKNFQKKLTIARKQQRRNKHLLQNMEISR